MMAIRPPASLSVWPKRLAVSSAPAGATHAASANAAASRRICKNETMGRSGLTLRGGRVALRQTAHVLLDHGLVFRRSFLRLQKGKCFALSALEFRDGRKIRLIRAGLAETTGGALAAPGGIRLFP